MPQLRRVRADTSRVSQPPVNCHRAASLPLPPGGRPHRRGALVVLCVAVLLCSACATRILEQARAIHPGATPALVREVLGAPKDRQVRGAQEAWQYCETGVVQDTFVVVWFAEGAVTGMTTYNNAVGDIGFFCASHVQPIRWDEAPALRSDMRQREGWGALEAVSAYVRRGLLSPNLQEPTASQQ
jgi:hypothetical protein